MLARVVGGSRSFRRTWKELDDQRTAWREVCRFEGGGRRWPRLGSVTYELRGQVV